MRGISLLHDISFWFLGTWVLCLPIDNLSINHCHIKIYVVWYTVVRLDLASIGFPLGNEGIINLCGTICQERKTVVGVISSIYLLLAFGVAYSTFLKTLTLICNNNFTPTSKVH